MADKRIALVTGANQGVGFQVAKELAAHGVTVLVGSRNFDRGEAAATEIGAGAIRDPARRHRPGSIAAAAERIRSEVRPPRPARQQRGDLEHAKASDRDPRGVRAARSGEHVSLDEIRAVWETNVFGVLAVYQAMLPLLRESSDARIVNVSSGVGSLTANADPAYPYHAMFGPVYPASKAALNAMTLAMMVELEATDIKVNLVSPAYTSTALNDFAGTESIEDGSREVVRVALLGPDGPTGTFTRWENDDDSVVDPVGRMTSDRGPARLGRGLGEAVLLRVPRPDRVGPAPV